MLNEGPARNDQRRFNPKHSVSHSNYEVEIGPLTLKSSKQNKTNIEHVRVGP